MTHETDIVCRCGGYVRIEDQCATQGDDSEFRFESYCDKCKTCDPNGWATLEQAKKEAVEYFA